LRIQAAVWIKTLDATHANDYEQHTTNKD